MTAINIHIHEDAWGMRSLHPLEAFSELVVDHAEAADASVRNFDGSGWADAYLIREPSSDFTSTSLTEKMFVTLMAPLMPKVGRFVATATGGFDPKVFDRFGSYDDEPICFGFGANCFIKLEMKDAQPKSVWFNAHGQEKHEFELLRKALLAINEHIPSVVSDYYLDVCGSLSDPVFLERYFQLLGGESA
jgi:hypothetical protein